MEYPSNVLFVVKATLIPVFQTTPLLPIDNPLQMSNNVCPIDSNPVQISTKISCGVVFRPLLTMSVFAAISPGDKRTRKMTDGLDRVRSTVD